ncbi:MAG: N-terminal phage integrase SAM-like domain-containing protein [Actinomycetota bacterium]|nr:N-terminal phage integrase SAM-like domain-containing protein [Actinomycetota bacterium]
MTSSESGTRRRKPARKANGSGTIKNRKDGRYEGQVFVRTTSGEFKRISVYGRSWEECDEKITRLKSDNYAGIGASVSSYTVSQWLSYWLEDVVKPARKPSTYVGYEVAVRLYLAPQLGKIKLTALKTADVRGMLNRIRQNASAAPRDGMPSGWRASVGAVRWASAAVRFPTRPAFITCSGRSAPRWVWRWPRRC